MIATRIVTSSSDSFSPSSPLCRDDDDDGDDCPRFHHDNGFRLYIIRRELLDGCRRRGPSTLPSATGECITSLYTDRGWDM